jgi:genome maintenance exonuclease 1
MKNFIHHEYPVIKRIDTDNGRLYEVPNGNRYPSVTTVTGKLNEAAIKAWRDRVGEDEANRISNRAASRGTQIHELCESFLKGEPLQVDMFNHDMWTSLKPIVDKIDNIHALENMLYTDKLEMAGTVDCIGEYDGELSVIDFKTAKRPKEESKIENYFIQATAYSLMFEEMYGIKIPNIVIIVGVDDELPQVFKKKRKDYIQKLVKLRLNVKNNVL